MGGYPRTAEDGGEGIPPAARRSAAWYFRTGGIHSGFLTLRADPNAAAEVTIGQRIVYVDGYTGKDIGEGSVTVRRFFRAVTDWHRWLAMSGSWRPLGRSITGAANLAFLGWLSPASSVAPA